MKPTLNIHPAVPGERLKLGNWCMRNKREAEAIVLLYAPLGSLASDHPKKVQRLLFPDAVVESDRFSQSPRRV